MPTVSPHVINFYRWLQTGLRISTPMENDAEFYYAYRQRFNQLIRSGHERSQEAAELFYYLNRSGYNGLCCFNRRGEFNVPFGRHKRINYTTDFTSYRSYLARRTFSTLPFGSIPLRPDDFVYADPPYDVEFRQYASNDFDWNDQVRLAEWLSHHEGPVALSNQATECIVRLYKRLGFEILYLSGPRRISCNGDRRPAREVLALRNI